ncbi:TolC family protein [Ohtaekwangia koreensis]|uniref:Outer membrane protein TolC n=1 Tax=Ohtaekwangia koreensis TaxID=688867 RepID=A0A1T5L6A7_9BACT|nr:TolC family protein [Ohtaekwangia koreensis]SKC71473.1 Outer membrane protein TolC [Ohtaekwangia koreensis]
MYRKISILIIGLLTALQLQAQSVKRLTLKEAIDLGVVNSKQLIVSNAKVKEAQAKLQQAQDKVIPEVGVSGTYLHLNTPNVSFSQESSSNGGSSDSPLASLANLHDIALLQVSASWPVFNGFRTRNTKIMNEYLEQAAQYDAQTTKSNVALTIAKAIYQYYELLETRKTIEENLKQEQQRVTEFKNQEAQNLLARNDRLKAELQMNNVELALTEVNNNVKLADYNLAILLGLPDETIVEIDTVGMFELAKLTTWDEYLQTGLANRTELKSATVQVKAGESGYKIAKANRLPTVALTAGYVNAFIPNVVNITNALNGGVSLKYSITGAIHASHGMQEARARVEQAEASRQIMTDQVKVNIREKYLNCQKSLEQLAITEKAIEQAEENFQISQNKYKQGLLILSDYLEADVALLQARINYATTRAESMIAYYELQESVGTLQ